MNTIVIGCGSSVENVYAGHSKSLSYPWYPYKHHDHKNCVTVDINAICSPDVVMDFTTGDIREVQKKFKGEKFDLIVLENLPTEIYHNNNDNTYNLVRNISLISTETSYVFIPRAFNVDYVIRLFLQHGFYLKIKSNDFRLISTIISSFIGREFEIYIFGKQIQNKLVNQLSGRDTFPYLLFKRFGS